MRIRPAAAARRGTLGMMLAATSAAASAQVDTAPILARICVIPDHVAGQPQPPEPTSQALRERLAYATLFQAGILPDQIAADPALGDGPLGERAREAAFRRDVADVPQQAISELLRLVQRLEQALAQTAETPPKSGLQAVGAVTGARNWLFDPASAATLKCIRPAVTGRDPETSDPPARIAQFETPEQRRRLSLRKTQDELGLTGDEARKAGSAQLGVKRERTEQDDGTKKTVTTATFDGTLGLRVSPNRWATPAYIYGGYTLSRARTRPAPALVPGKSAGDDDTDALEVGLSMADMLIRSDDDYSLALTASSGVTFDFVKNSRRWRTRASLTPGVPFSLGPFCDFGGYNVATVDDLKFRARCTLSLEAEASDVLRAGTADFKRRANFIALGGKAAYEVATPVGKDSAIIASVAYRWLGMIGGEAPEIERVDAMLKYRLFLDTGFAVDFGFSYGKGTEPKSLKEEDKLEFGLGLLF